MKQVRETAAGRSISAYVILKGKKEVALIHVHYGSSRVMVDVWDHTTTFQRGSASGGGYDKKTAAMRGLIIDGITLHDHCGRSDKSNKILTDYQSGKLSIEQATIKAKKIGASFANWNRETKKYSSLHIRGGLERLPDMGYTVIQAI